MVLTCVSLMMSELEHPFTCLLETSTYSGPLPVFERDASAPCPAEVSVRLDAA